MEEDLLERFERREVAVVDASGVDAHMVIAVLACHTCRSLVLEEDGEAHIVWCDGVSGGASDAEALLA